MSIIKNTYTEKHTQTDSHEMYEEWRLCLSMNEWIELNYAYFPTTVSDLIVCFLFEDNEIVSGNCARLLCFRFCLCFFVCIAFSLVLVWMDIVYALLLMQSLLFSLFHALVRSQCAYQKHFYTISMEKEFKFFYVDTVSNFRNNGMFKNAILFLSPSHVQCLPDSSILHFIMTSVNWSIKYNW